MLIAISVGISVYILGVLLAPKTILSGSTSFTRKQLKGLEKQQAEEEFDDFSHDISKNRYQTKGILAKIFYSMPLATQAHPYLVKGGIAGSVDKLFLVCLLVFFVCFSSIILFTGINNPLLSLIISAFIAYFVGWSIIKNKIKKRIRKFIDQFPDALDIIIRSVKSGFPINAAVNMVAESMPAPAGEEFKQVSNEILHGSTLVDAMTRLGERMQTPDVRFFVVVLTLQQEVGGNLAEVLGNLSMLIRKRKMMAKKIRAITSEGRFTGWILGSLPVFVAAIIFSMDPRYMEPLITTHSGYVVLGITIALIATGVWIIRQMVDMEI